MLIFDMQGSDNISALVRPSAVLTAFSVVQRSNEDIEVRTGQERWRETTDANIQELLSKGMHQEDFNQSMWVEFEKIKRTVLDLQECDQAKDREIESLRQENAAMSQRMEEMIIAHEKLVAAVSQLMQPGTI